MFNKQSCRGCGNNLSPIVLCNVCGEYVKWICKKCRRLDEADHIHTYDIAYTNYYHVIRTLTFVNTDK